MTTEAGATEPDVSRRTAGELVLSVNDLHVDFHTREGVVQAVNGVSFDVYRGRTLAILGASGSGKSVTAQAVMGILDTPPAKISSGSIEFEGTDLLALSEKDRRMYRGRRI